jgi:GT2 family glycosyltransferase
MKLSVAALIATYRRPRELERLLNSLAQVGEGLAAAIVVDNEGSAEVRALVEKAGPWAHYVAPGTNLGCGGGLRLAGERALELAGGTLTHLLILDDDAVLPPGTLAALAKALEKELANLAYPLVTADGGRLGWLPGLAERTRELRDTFEGTPEDFRARFGSKPRDVVWAQGICLLVTIADVKRWGLHRDDFWVRGEDMEFSLRLTAHGRGVLVPTVVVQHLPPPETAPVSREAEYLKHCALVQNIAFIGFRLRHGHRIAWTMPGALRRFFRIWSWAAIGDALLALWRGAVLGQPAGTGAGQTSARPARTFRARFAALPPRAPVSS